MKKIITLLAVIGMFGFQGCEGPDGAEGPAGPNSEVFEVSKINFSSTNGSAPLISLSPAIEKSQMVLVYRLSGSTDEGEDIWKSLPETYYLNDGRRDFGFKFDFSINDVSIFMEGNDLGNVLPSFRLNQIFRIVILPGYVTYPTSKTTSKKVDFSDYNAVIKAYNIDDRNVKRLN